MPNRNATTTTNTMKTELQKELAKICPSISISTIWEHDPDSGPISKECELFDASEDDDWQAWQSNVRAVAVVDGEEIEGNAYLGGIFEKYGDVPGESNPTILGYEPHMTVEALKELKRQIEDDCTVKAIDAAIAAIKSRA